jgi:uncharacterized protein YciI
MKYYLCKYIPPRADFLTTLSAQEQEWMRQHGEFLNELLARGLIIAHGPVLDDAGGYGVSIYQVDDDADISAITAKDPIMRQGVGRYEHYVMPHLRARGP